MDEVKVEIVELITGGYRVSINDLPIVQFPESDEAINLVTHFIKINPGKKVKWSGIGGELNADRQKRMDLKER